MVRRPEAGLLLLLISATIVFAALSVIVFWLGIGALP